MRRRVMTLAAMAVVISLEAGCRSVRKDTVEPDWLPRIAGIYDGEVLNEGRMCPVVTQFGADEESGPWGQYVITVENDLFKGQLFSFRFPGNRQIACRWLDANGVGDLAITFDDSFSAFDGYWKSDDDSTRHPWNGRMTREGNE